MIKRVGTQSVGIVQEHHKLKHCVLVIGESKVGAARESLNGVSGVYAVLPARMVHGGSKELGVRRAAVEDLIEHCEVSAPSGDLLPFWRKVLHQRLNPDLK